MPLTADPRPVVLYSALAVDRPNPTLSPQGRFRRRRCQPRRDRAEASPCGRRASERAHVPRDTEATLSRLGDVHQATVEARVIGRAAAVRTLDRFTADGRPSVGASGRAVDGVFGAVGVQHPLSGRLGERRHRRGLLLCLARFTGIAGRFSVRLRTMRPAGCSSLIALIAQRRHGCRRGRRRTAAVRLGPESLQRARAGRPVTLR